MMGLWTVKNPRVELELEWSRELAVGVLNWNNWGIVSKEEMEGSFEQTLQDGKLYRQVNSLIVAHLRDHNLTQASFSLRVFNY